MKEMFRAQCEIGRYILGGVIGEQTSTFYFNSGYLSIKVWTVIFVIYFTGILC
jgi:hypothetical protein